MESVGACVMCLHITAVCAVCCSYKRMVEEKAKEREYRLKQMARAEIIRCVLLCAVV